MLRGVSSLSVSLCLPPPGLSLSLSRSFSRARRSSRLPSSLPASLSASSPRGLPVLPVLKYPHPQLRAPNKEVEIFDDSLTLRAQTMLKCMYLHRGVGLAAPQVGVNERLIVLNPEGSRRKGDPRSEIALVNPKILKSSPSTDVDEESCLSIPLVFGNVERSSSIMVQYKTLSGEERCEEFQEYPARIIQHEIDHLDGILYIDRMNLTDLKVYQDRLERYIVQYGQNAAI